MESKKSKNESEIEFIDNKQLKNNKQENKNQKSQEEEKLNQDDKVSDLENEISNLKDLYLRKHAEFENFRKRLEKDKDHFIKFANENIMKEIVNFLDNLERAIESSTQSKDFNNLLTGIKMIESEILSNLDKKYNLKKFGEPGEIFDPIQHEAISIEEKEGLENPTIIEVYQKGYCYNDRILRTAKVKVAQNKN